MKKVQRSSFKLNPIAAAIVVAMSAQLPANTAMAGSGWGLTNLITAPAVTVPVQTYYANSPSGSVVALDSKTGLPAFDPVTTLPIKVDSGKALRKFVDTLPGFGPGAAAGVYSTPTGNNLGQYIPIANNSEKWTDGSDYYEIAAVEYAEQMHSDLPKATHLRGYVQLVTPGLAALGVTGVSFTTLDGRTLQVVDKPHHLGPVINATKGTAVRVKFTNYLPTGGNLFLPVDKSLTGAGLGPDGKTYYTENRAEIHLVGGEAPWISAGSPHQWVAPAGETAAYTASVGKGVSTKDVPDMAASGPGSTTLYFPNAQSARFTFYQDRTSGLTRLNNYAGLEAGYTVTDSAESALIASGAIPADQIPLILEDKTFVPANVAQQDALWDTTHWGQPGDLWFPHVYERNQDPNAVNGLNSVGRWDYGPWFWPIFAASAPLPSGAYGDASFVPESYEDTPVINGTAYPTLTIDPKAYRFRIANVSNDRFFNLGLYKADATAVAPQLDRNGNQILDPSGNPLFFTNTEVKMLPAVADVTGAPPNPTSTTGLPYDTATSCYCQYPTMAQLLTYGFSGPTRAWPIDNRVGGAPDPASVGPDFIAIGNDGGFLPNPVDIPSQPVTYESNRRSVTVTNVYGYGLLVGPSERADVVVDFSPYAGQTLIVYNDAPTPFPFDDQRNDYFTGEGDLTSTGGTYNTLPGYGPNTRTIMQIKVNNVAAAPALDATKLTTALQAAYKAGQAAPIVPESAYNAALSTSATDLYAHVATGSVAQPTLDFTTGGAGLSLTGVNLISSGGQLIVGTTNIVGNAIPGSGTGYDPLNPPTVVFGAPGVDPCLPTTGTAATAFATVNAASHQVTAVTLGAPGQLTVPTSSGAGYVCAPQITFSSSAGVGAQAAAIMSAGTQSILVQTKAEQELFDNAGRYNSTGGVELPLTSGTTQTTVPLNYTDSPTEFIGDSEVQIWKLVDNGFWSNSMHFDMVDVQLINRVGWDGTVKAPANNEVGWKDTLRLNPLEDVIVAMRAKHPAVPFGLPASIRAQDPSIPLGATASTNLKSSQLPFLADPGVLSPQGASLLTTTVNTNVVVDNTSATSAKSTLGYDNEFTWATAVLGHSEDDFIRPVVYHPTVTAPVAPTSLAGSAGALTWVDATPAAAPTTIGNPANEVGFTVLKAPITGNAVGAYAAIATLPANTVSYTDPAASGASSYEVVAFNNAGSATSTPLVQIAALAAPTWAATTPVVVNTNGTIKLTWNKVTGSTNYLISSNGAVVATVQAAGGGGTTQNTTITLPWGVNYTAITIQSQLVFTGVTPSITANSVASAAVSASLLAFPATPAAPAASNVAATSLTLNWATVSGAASYNVQRATNANFNGATTTTGVTSPMAVTGLTANTTYYFRVVGVNGANTATGPSLTVATPQVAAPAAPAAPTASALAATTLTLNWTPVTGATSYTVQRATNQAFTTGVTTTTGTFTGASQAVTGLTGNTTYYFRVTATNAGGSTVGAVSAAVLTAPATPGTVTGTRGAAGSLAGTLTWAAPAGTGTITGFVIQVSNAANGTFVTVPVGGTTGVRATINGATAANPAGTGATINGLTANSTYSFRLSVTNASGTSAYSAGSTVFTAR